MKIDFEDRVWQLEMDEVTVKQGVTIQDYTGLSPTGWYKSITDTDGAAWLKSMQCLYWLMLWQNPQYGAARPISDVDFAPLKLIAAFATAAGNDDAAAEQAAETDPTKPAGAPGGAAQNPSLQVSPAG